MIKRNTIQCTLVLEAAQKLQNHPTADEIYAALVKEHPNIGRATVYRNLQRLCETGALRRREVPGAADRFDHCCTNHYHVACQKCGRLFDVDMDYIPDMQCAIKDAHGFVFTGYDIVFKGICPQCSSQQPQG